MRLLAFHVDHFAATATDRTRSRLREPRPDGPLTVDEGLLVLANVEAGDEVDLAGVAAAAAEQLASLARQVGARRALVLPFAHLFGEPGEPEAALRLLDELSARLSARGVEARRAPFGWFFAWELRAKGHPLSRVARRIAPRRPAGPGADRPGEASVPPAEERRAGEAGGAGAERSLDGP
jgi:threonyl-tRNA synthetase